MPLFVLNNIKPVLKLKYFIVFVILLSSCGKNFLTPITTIKKKPKGKYFVAKNTIKITEGNFSRNEKQALIQRLTNQLDDSSKVTVNDTWLILHNIIRPPVYDSGYAKISARNMEASMFHLGYYSAHVTFQTDTFQKKIHVIYSVQTGKPTLIDTVSYRLRKPDLQEITLGGLNEALLAKNDPVTKTAVLSEIGRLVDSFRNNGYYKFTAAELRVRGDTTIEALTTVSDDPFEQLRLLAEAQQQRDSPHIKLAVVLNPPSDSSKLNKYYINNIYVFPDFRPDDNILDTNILTDVNRNFIVRYHNKLFRSSFLGRNITLRKGDIYRQQEYYNTVNNFSNKGVWQSVNIRIQEVPDSTNKVDLIIELLPGKKYGFEASLEASYSATSNTTAALAGNLFGTSLNFSLLNRNFGKEAIRMTNAVRLGIELNNNARSSSTRLVNSQEVSYSNNIVFPRLPRWPKQLKSIFSFKDRNIYRPFSESFINSTFSLNNRFDLFNLQSVNLGAGWTYMTDKNWKIIIKPFNLAFSSLFNQTDSFKHILEDNPFLRYSYNTALIAGTSVGFSQVYRNPVHPGSIYRERSLRINIEESGMTWGALPILKKYKSKYIKPDFEYKYTVAYNKTAIAFRGFLGIGIALGKDTTLPFFKQYFGGGSNSMRGWPIRGIGIGSQKQVDYKRNVFNDRTADMQFETNIEYRYDIARIIPNTLTLRGALFADIGNIWNLKNSNPDGRYDSTQFKLRNFYRELGVAAGTGFRLDFNYFILRLDLGFRFKRPERSDINDGWKAPPIGFDDAFKKIFGRSEESRKWRYENFNFTIGISYPF